MKNNFSRSNVNEESLSVSQPLRSSFNLSHRVNFTLPLGRFLPVNIEPLIPSDTVQGSLSPKLQLENLVTPTVGRIRLDTHTFAVNARRINKDWKTFIEQSADGNPTMYRPSFSPAALYATIFAMLMTGNSTTKVADIMDNLKSLFSGTTYSGYLIGIIGKAVLYYDTRIATTSSEYGYLKDFYAVEAARLRAYGRYITSLGIGLTMKDVTLAQVVHEIMLPYAGEGSTMDMAGYSLYSTYSVAYQALDNFFKTTTDTWATVYSTLDEILIVDIFKLLNLTIAGGSFEFDAYIDPDVDEMPLRAIYACWYDYMRNWHIEKRSEILNPDNFDSVPVIDFVYTLTDQHDKLAQWLQLIVTKYRMFSRDILTTVQTDAKFRHVYSPISDSDLTGVTVQNAQDINSILKLNIDGINQYFPSGLFDYFTSSSSTMPALKHDLQTLKRASMLEKWLARNYYFPDTYVGQVQARFGVKPEDFGDLCSVYLGGTEQFVSGDQQVANVGTSETPVGQRTMVGGVDAKDSFTFSTRDYGWIVSFVSLVPMVHYDAKNMHLRELTTIDTPNPEFATDTRVEIRTNDILRGFQDDNDVLGYVPRYYQYRVHADENHGQYLDRYRSYSWFRDWYNMFFSSSANPSARKFALNPYCLRVHLAPEAFAGLSEWDSIAFGSCDIEMIANRALPAAVEFI